MRDSMNKAKRRKFAGDFPPQYSDHPRFNRDNCGACLLPLIDESENSLSELLLVAKPDLCDHLFHDNCLKTWATRDTSCPQCRLRFDYIGTYKIDGVLNETKKTPQAFLGDLLDEEDDYSSEEDGDYQESTSEDTQGPTQHLESIAEPNAVESPLPVQNGESSSDAQKAASRNRIKRRLRAEVGRMRAQLAAERRRELSEQQQILARVDPELVKLSVVRNLKRLPYQFKPREGAEAKSARLLINQTGRGTCVEIQTEQKRLIVPKILRKAPATTVDNRFARLRQPPTYEQDFLLHEQCPNVEKG
eukprot:Protomagalhaensia_wolfi_Nauph_80__2307@NODE_2508_length_1072_cov_32_996128_g1966_i0_p1_GENE_NODE_2508_length_1072_cov_32_996128_g1966_i0NODE_2508_length_1072_cov_32_996128_g1966_i0_p1_ORF_typecomplete_len304_score36_95zfRING_2/PF13639_6/9_8e09zfrbx1/PF12678_7/2_7e07ProkRING_4/PF14447_6/2_6e06zfANAPC11/PF12861_7/3_3e06zfC3HC4_2/PF13923_6/0_0001zfRING_5/PF14634_6/0_00023zfC3HC4/PF00097_25/0_00024zfC3H2C3/PF17122_5/0_00056zfC3H2C3/PF17122_5/5_6e03zfC3HC4_3/PF13920_6/0_0052Zn_ribbon_17/PF17120_5/0_0